MDEGSPAVQVASPQAVEAGVVTLDSNVTIASARVLHEQLQTLLEQQTPISLDASGVERADAAALQLFCSLFRTAELQQLSCQWSGISDAMRQAALLCGLEQALAMPAQ